MAREELDEQRCAREVQNAYETARSAGEKRFIGVGTIAEYCDLTGKEIRKGIRYLAEVQGGYIYTNNRLGRG